jgi:hypothetical protein
MKRLKGNADPEEHMEYARIAFQSSNNIHERGTVRLSPLQIIELHWFLDSGRIPPSNYF